MKIEAVIAKIHSGWKLVVKPVKDENGKTVPSAVLVSPHTVPDSTDKVYHKPVAEGGGPEAARETLLTLAVPPQHLEALEALLEPVEGETNESQQVFASSAVVARLKARPGNPDQAAA